MTDKTTPDNVLGGLEFDPLPAGWTPIGAVMMVKCLDEEGRPTWSFRTSEDMSDEEVLGALVVRTELQRQSLLEDYTDPDD